MKRAVSLVVVGLVLASLGGCAGATMAFAPVIPPTGIAYSSISAPLDVDLDKTALGTKVGKASTQCILGLVAFGDASTAAAARNGGLKVVNHADYEASNIFIFYSTYTTIVYGD